MIVVPPIFLCTLCLGHDLRRYFGLRRRMVFLDKTCIHQEDKELQRSGILKLGAFLRSSSQMVVIYSDIYLTRLWTVYEVACFLALRPASQLVIVPTHQPAVIFVTMFFDYVILVLFNLVENLQHQVTLLSIAIFTLVRFTFCVRMLRSWAHSHKAIYEQV